MKPDGFIKTWLYQIRAPFLILSVALVFIGAGASHYFGAINWNYVVLLCLGVVLSHISVNLFNEYYDHKTGIDSLTSRTPFSGGSGMLQQGRTSPKSVITVAYITLIFAGGIGFYFFLERGWPVLVFMTIGALSIRFYTTHLTKWFIGEASAGICLGICVVTGSFFVLTGKINVEILFVAVPPAILTSLLLLLNEFPDIEADRKGGRHNVVIYFGTRKVSIFYVCSLAVVYLFFISTPFVIRAPYTVLAPILTIPLAIKNSKMVLTRGVDRENILPILGTNVVIVILADILLATGYFIS